MRKTKTERVYEDNLPTLNRWKVALGLPSIAALLDKWIEDVTKEKKKALYDNLSPKVVFNPVKLLAGKRIRKVCT